MRESDQTYITHVKSENRIVIRQTSSKPPTNSNLSLTQPVTIHGGYTGLHYSTEKHGQND